MKTFHTPGPWILADSTEYGDGFCEVVDSRTESYSLAGHFRRSETRHMADARLIAAAPEMLEALHRLTLEVESILAHAAGPTRDEMLERLHKDTDGKLRSARRALLIASRP